MQTEYGMKGGELGVLYPNAVKDFSVLYTIQRGFQDATSYAPDVYRGQIGRGLKLTTNLHPRLRMSGVIPPAHHTPLWRAV
jgi:hypothetical protein